MKALLEIKNLGKSYDGPQGTVQALEEISLTVGAGEFVAIRGPSGCGKTTLLLAAGTLLRPSQGQVFIHDQDPYALSSGQRAQFRASHIGFVFQQFHLVPYLDVLDNILAPVLAIAAHGQEKVKARELAERFGLEARLHHTPSLLSTGERQRVALARALVNAPKLLLADEPTGNLDEGNSHNVMRYLAEFAHGGGSVLLVTHEPRASEHASRLLLMAQGRII